MEYTVWDKEIVVNQSIINKKEKITKYITKQIVNFVFKQDRRGIIEVYNVTTSSLEKWNSFFS